MSEKPCTTSLKDTMELVDLAQTKGLALYENYAFGLHRQIFKIRELIEEGRRTFVTTKKWAAARSWIAADMC